VFVGGLPHNLELS